MRRVLLPVGLLLVAGGIYWAIRSPGRKAPIALPPASRPTTTVAVAPATAPALPKPVDYMGVVRHSYPDFPTTQPLLIPVAMNEAARLLIKDPIFLDTNGELWITRADAEPTSTMFKGVQERSSHVLKEHVVYVHRAPDDTHVWQPRLICKKEDGSYEIVTRSGRRDIQPKRNFQWHRAFSWNNGSESSIVVPTDRGVSIIRPDRLPMEFYHEFVPADQYDPAKYSRVEALFDWKGVIAWMPWDDGKNGSEGAARFAENAWSVLDSKQQWPRKLLHLLPLTDGSVLQLVLNNDGTSEVLLQAQDLAGVDAKVIETLVDELSDTDSTKRERAFGKLATYGVGSWPVLERLLPNQPPEARFRIEQLLAAKSQPNLGGMILQRGPVKVLARGDVGSALIYAEQGVAIPRMEGADPGRVVPAWLSIVPGQSIALVPQGFADEIKVPGRRLKIHRGEWIVSDDTGGPKWWVSNHFSGNLLKPEEVRYQELIGLDARGRWLFRENSESYSPTLIIDPTLPDPRPRLPIWIYAVDEGGSVGWNSQDWPAIKFGGAWALVNDAWDPLDETKTKYITEPPTPLSALGIGQTLGEPILVEKDGTRFHGGQFDLRMTRPDGKRVVWPLPPEAMGMGRVFLARAGEDRLFLFNARGRLIRIRQMKDGPEPFKMEQVFTKNVPNVDRPTRMWVDPKGRLVIAFEGRKLAIAFPDGKVPQDIAKIMTAKDLSEIEQ